MAARRLSFRVLCSHATSSQMVRPSNDADRVPSDPTTGYKLSPTNSSARGRAKASKR
ncbi:hypothetical protein D3C81_2149390 [compost metagenome]